METQEQPQYINPEIANGTALLEGVSGEDLPKLPPASETATARQWRQFSDRVSLILEKLPSDIARYFNQYKPQITTIALIVSAIIAVKVVLAILDAIDDIPLIAFVLELVGIAYSTWFISRYMLKASTRQELVAEINNIKKQIIGRNISDSPM